MKRNSLILAINRWQDPIFASIENYVLFCLISTAVGPGPLRAERRSREVRREIFTSPELVTARRLILGPSAEGRPGPSRK